MLAGTSVTVRSEGAWDNVRVSDARELRQFMHDIARRHERIWREQREALIEMRAELRELREESRADREQRRVESRELILGLREVREESRAQTQALLHVLDKLQNGGAAA